MKIKESPMAQFSARSWALQILNYDTYGALALSCFLGISNCSRRSRSDIQSSQSHAAMPLGRTRPSSTTWPASEVKSSGRVERSWLVAPVSVVHVARSSWHTRNECEEIYSNLMEHVWRLDIAFNLTVLQNAFKGLFYYMSSTDEQTRRDVPAAIYNSKKKKII